ncbi:MAG: hypothetical protein ACFFE4_17180 [Candidatus Thorarchaeota archaeon]
MNFIKRNSPVFLFIGGLLTLIATLTPTEFHTEPGNTYFVWMWQISLETDPGPFIISLLRIDPTLLTFSILFSVILFSTSIISISASVFYRKRNKDPKEHKKSWLILASAIILSTLAWIIMMEIFYRINGFPHWSIGGGGYIPNFGVIGQFIGAVFIILGVLYSNK